MKAMRLADSGATALLSKQTFRKHNAEGRSNYRSAIL
jgi:hypothetical protein